MREHEKSLWSVIVNGMAPCFRGYDDIEKQRMRSGRLPGRYSSGLDRIPKKSLLGGLYHLGILPDHGNGGDAVLDRG